MLTSQESLKQFLAAKGNTFPFNTLKQLRNRYYFKWILLKSMHEKEPRQSTSTHVVLASSFDTETLQHLIISGQGIPVAPVMDEIMDWMHYWGRGKSMSWYQESMDVLEFYCKEGIAVSKREVVFEILSIRVRQRIWYALQHTLHLGWLTYNEWHDWFNFQYESVTTDFFDLYMKSDSYIKDRLELLVGMATAHFNNTNSTEEPADAPLSSAVVSP